MGRQVRPLGLGGKATTASHQGGQPGNRPRVPASLPFLPWAGSLHPADTCLLKQCQPAMRGTPQGHVNLISLCSRGDLRQTLGYGRRKHLLFLQGSRVSDSSSPALAQLWPSPAGHRCSRAFRTGPAPLPHHILVPGLPPPHRARAPRSRTSSGQAQ